MSGQFDITEYRSECLKELRLIQNESDLKLIFLKEEIKL